MSLSLLALLALAAQFLQPCQLVADEQPIRAARDALRGDFPWYDSQHDRIQRIDVAPPKDLRNRHSRWEARQVNWDFPNWPDWLLQFLEVLVWVLLASLLAAAVYLMVRAFLSHESRAAAGASPGVTVGPGDAERVDRLPFQLERRQVNLLDEARRLYELGRFNEAIVYLYSYQLLALDKHQVIRLTRGKTNRQYLRETRRRPVVRSLLERTMIAFEDVFFGNHALERSRFESCWQSLEQFHDEIQKAFA